MERKAREGKGEKENVWRRLWGRKKERGCIEQAEGKEMEERRMNEEG